MTHDGYTNKYSLVHNNRAITLVPLTPKQVHEDQLKLQQERVKQRESVQKSKNAKEKENESAKTDREVKEKEREKKSDKMSGEEKRERSQKNFFTGAREVRRAFLTKQPMILFFVRSLPF